MAVSGKVTSAGIAGPGSSTDYAVSLWNGTLGDTLRTQSNLLVESGLVKVRQSGGVAGVDEGQLSHDGSNFRIEVLDGDFQVRTPNTKRLVLARSDVTSRYLALNPDLNATGQEIESATSLRLKANTSLIVQADEVNFRSYLTNISRWRLGHGGTDIMALLDGTGTGRGSLTLLNMGATGYIELTEMTAPSSPAANSARIYSEDDGGGKTRVVIKWSGGTTTVLGTQP